ncbi:hypothetical protein MLD38_006805 [Melastoma candidum]|uniref:Uncharacterized protein n=1 Tax=Melastoma candidum TaxID=119954 RepID=A0ACB9RNS7_9MYRT|nr:hypothetical protein MLD38_006805 [Melastoma candidum]
MPTPTTATVVLYNGRIDCCLFAFPEPGRANPLRCTYVLPDGVTCTEGFVKDPADAERCVKITNGSTFTFQQTQSARSMIPTLQRIERESTSSFNLTNERFLVPEMIFQPADMGMNQAGIAECIVRSINACHPDLHPLLYEKELCICKIIFVY